jgi:hypothetical protein
MATKKPVSLVSWLAEKRQTASLSMALGSLGLLAASGVTLLITYWILYVVMAFFSMTVLTDFAVGQWAPLVGIVVLFVLQVIVRQRDLEDYKFEGGSRQTMALVAARATGFGMLALAAGPQTAISFGKLCLSILLIGPALFFGGLRLAARAWRLSKLDVERCAPILATLYSDDRKFPFQELMDRHRAEAPERALPQLADLGGVLFRTSDPPGLSLSAELREEIRAGRKKSKTPAAD